jgi:hypothetical protein
MGSSVRSIPRSPPQLELEYFAYHCIDSRALCVPGADASSFPRGLLSHRGEMVVVSRLIISSRDSFGTDSLLIPRNIEEIVREPVRDPMAPLAAIVRSFGSWRLDLGSWRLTAVAFESPPSLRLISSWGLFGCLMLQSICLPASLQDIESWGFEDCTRLATVMFEPGSRPRIGTSAFYCCPLMEFLGLAPDLVPVRPSSEIWTVRP